ncbi:MAG: hypothetical protein ACF8XB_08825 [Planctomycetota bacterium JB042]
MTFDRPPEKGERFDIDFGPRFVEVTQRDVEEAYAGSAFDRQRFVDLPAFRDAPCSWRFDEA